MLEKWKARAHGLKHEVYALLLAYKDPRTPWYAKVWAACVVGYAFSPIDLVPDFIPVLGYLDDLVLIPLGITLALRLIPTDVMDDCRQRAQAEMVGRRSPGWIAGVAIITVWLIVLLVAGKALYAAWFR